MTADTGQRGGAMHSRVNRQGLNELPRGLLALEGGLPPPLQTQARLSQSVLKDPVPWHQLSSPALQRGDRGQHNGP